MEGAPDYGYKRNGEISLYPSEICDPIWCAKLVIRCDSKKCLRVASKKDTAVEWSIQNQAQTILDDTIEI